MEELFRSAAVGGSGGQLTVGLVTAVVATVFSLPWILSRFKQTQATTDATTPSTASTRDRRAQTSPPLSSSSRRGGVNDENDCKMSRKELQEILEKERVRCEETFSAKLNLELDEERASHAAELEKLKSELEEAKRLADDLRNQQTDETRLEERLTEVRREEARKWEDRCLRLETKVKGLEEELSRSQEELRSENRVFSEEKEKELGEWKERCLKLEEEAKRLEEQLASAHQEETKLEKELQDEVKRLEEQVERARKEEAEKWEARILQVEQGSKELEETLAKVKSEEETRWKLQQSELEREMKQREEKNAQEKEEAESMWRERCQQLEAALTELQDNSKKLEDKLASVSKEHSEADFEARLKEKEDLLAISQASLDTERQDREDLRSQLEKTSSALQLAQSEVERLQSLLESTQSLLDVEKRGRLELEEQQLAETRRLQAELSAIEQKLQLGEQQWRETQTELEAANKQLEIEAKRVTTLTLNLDEKYHESQSLRQQLLQKDEQCQVSESTLSELRVELEKIRKRLEAKKAEFEVEEVGTEVEERVEKLRKEHEEHVQGLNSERRAASGLKPPAPPEEPPQPVLPASISEPENEVVHSKIHSPTPLTSEIEPHTPPGKPLPLPPATAPGPQNSSDHLPLPPAQTPPKGPSPAPSPRGYVVVRPASMVSVEYAKLSPRERVATEILTTEKSYVKYLTVIVDLFLKPLEAASEAESLLLSKDELHSIFGNITTICAHNQLLADVLQRRLEGGVETVTFGDIFIDADTYLQGYEEYCLHYPSAIRALNQLIGEKPAFAEFIECTQSRPEMNHLTLIDLLIMPIQRIPRYCMLLQELHRQTDPSHMDKPLLEDALVKIKILADKINEGPKIAENANKIASIQQRLVGWSRRGSTTSSGSGIAVLLAPGRKYIREGELTITESAGLKHKLIKRRRYCVLFNDLLLETKEEIHTTKKKILKSIAISTFHDDQSGPTKDKLKFKRAWPLQSLSSISVLPGNGIRLFTTEGQLDLSFSSIQEKEEWAAALKGIGLSESSE